MQRLNRTDAGIKPVQLCHGEPVDEQWYHILHCIFKTVYKFSDSPHRLKATAQREMLGWYKHWKDSVAREIGANVRTKTEKLVQLRAKATAALVVHANYLALGTCLEPWYGNSPQRLYFFMVM